MIIPKLKAFSSDLRLDLGKTEEKKLDNVIKIIIGEMIVKGWILWLLSLSFFPLFSRGTVRFLHLVARRSHLLSNVRFVTGFFLRVDATPQKRFLVASIFFLVWGTLDFIEALGLWQRRRWAEYLAVVSTSIFIPVEVYTTLTRFTGEKLAISVFNIFLVYYLVRSRKLFQFDRE